jgi:FAD/FMN-containing dehydrogenase
MLSCRYRKLQADVVKIITFVDGTGNITRASRNSNVGRGLVGGVGMLGVITEVTLQLKPGLSKMRSWGTGVRSDANFAQELLQLWVSCMSSVIKKTHQGTSCERYNSVAGTPDSPVFLCAYLARKEARFITA